MSIRLWGWMMLGVALVTIPLSASAQDEETPAESDEVVEEEAAPTDPLSAARALGGDVIIMKSGAIMGGVQIIDKNSKAYEIEIVPGAEPMIIPRRLVESVETDEYEPLREERRRARNPEPELKLMMDDGQEVSPELQKKLLDPIPQAPSKFERKDYIQIFNEIGKLVDVRIVVDQSLVTGLPATRQWSVEIPEDMKLAQLLQESWLPSFPEGKIKYALDAVILHQKDVEPQPLKEAATGTPATTPLSSFKLGN